MNSQWIIVTGGNRGLGLDVCRKLANSGQGVLLCSRNLQKGRDAAAKIEKESGKPGICRSVVLDVSDPASIQSFISGMKADYSQQIYALFNNAAVYPDGWTQQVFSSTVQTNFTGPLDLALGLAPHICAGGRIINVTSGLGQLSNLSSDYKTRVVQAESLDSLRSMPFDAKSAMASAYKPMYCLTKAMLNRASQLLTKDPAFQHLSVNSADPGWCRTDMGGGGAPRSAGQGADSLLAVLRLPADVKGGFFCDGQPKNL